jgi:hypothetical protein
MRNPELESTLDSCIAEIQSGRATQEDCLQRYADHAAALEPLLREATRLMTVPQAAMTDEAVDALEQRLLMRAAEIRAPSQLNGLSVWSLVWSCLAGRRTRLLPAALSLVIALAVASTWVVSASAASFPGTTLYPIKLATEKARLAVAFRYGTRANLHLSFANQRLGETLVLLAAQRPVASSLLDALAVETTLAVEVIAEMDAGQQARAAAKLLALTERQQTVLALVPATEGTERGLGRALEASRRGQDHAMAVLDITPEPYPMPLRRPTATPTPTLYQRPARRPTYTPSPTHTLRATRTRKPTHTPKPTHTLHRRPTRKPRHTPTPTPTPRRQPTRKPTHTPKAPHTLRATRTRKPTHTPRPPPIRYR